ncbi:mannose-6-phosphate isomerase, class I [Sphaerisporangium siamense]|uniref:mannose-6-phosphate isomerase n=1 Tax=Sphaerisporangium siamense TaxID=795645 RepID=A0A7W7D7S3_9ACTN|nr:mannose-6-phosphate isomerase, class I [Sphaerisporangium siamense]MBB4701817.1 mannose-6-phosphate isomerase [Sphaerisporangium siamense]GII84275.1 mannose-6-phosphate isomerase, class I [Sphaerisporangium siamense]
MHLLTNPLKDYAWGSRTDIAELTGRPAPSPGPEAEMWLGTHPAGPSTLDGDGRSLADLIAADPLAGLGARTLERHGARLPFLLKLIAVARPLSLQVHPSAGQAAEGHARGVYGDPWAKPELVCALTPFTALAGFRAADQAAMLVDRLGVPGLKDVVTLLAEGAPLKALAALLDGRDIAEQAVWAASAVHQPDYALVVRLARCHPGDPACLAPLMLRRHELAPGQALFLGAGVLHCYVKGFGVEIMGSSDNVVRAGLTAKPVDVAELLRVAEPDAGPLVPGTGPDGVFDTPAPEFRLRRLVVDGETRLEGGVPRILLGVAGETRADGVDLGAGRSVFVPAADPAPTLSGSGVVFCAEPGVDG